MKEAWQYTSPFMRALVRRAEMIRYVFAGKNWHPKAGRWAKVRAFLLVISGHETEMCAICGRAVEMVWWCERDDLWAKLTGWQGGGGVCCVRCFSRLAEDAGICLQWSASMLVTRREKE